MKHPLWNHLPAIAALIIFIVSIVNAGPLPTEVPVHFNLGGEPDRYGSPWLAFGLVIGISVLFTALSVFLDELWAKQEKKKSFNWLSLLDELVVGAMVGISIGYLRFIESGEESFGFPISFSLDTSTKKLIIQDLTPMVRGTLILKQLDDYY